MLFYEPNCLKQKKKKKKNKNRRRIRISLVVFKLC